MLRYSIEEKRRGKEKKGRKRRGGREGEEEKGRKRRGGREGEEEKGRKRRWKYLLDRHCCRNRKAAILCNLMADKSLLFTKDFMHPRV